MLNLVNEPQNQVFMSVLKPHYNLRTPKGDKPSMLYLVFKIKKQYKISCGVKVIPSQWDKKNQRAMISACLSELDNQNNFITNKKISEFNGKFFNFISYLCNHIEEIENPTSAIRSHFDMKEKKTEPLSAILLRGLRSKDMKEQSFNAFKGQLDEFIGWQNANYPSMTLDDIDLSKLREYVSFLFESRVKHSVTGEMVQLEDNSVLNKIKNLMTILNYVDFPTERLKKIKNDFKVDKTYENKVTVTNEEIEALINLELEGTEEISRDLFLFQISTFQRFSDIRQLWDRDLKKYIKDNTFTLNQEKTGNKVTFAIDDIALSILEKYNYHLPKQRDCTINKDLKTICKMIGMNEICPCRELRGRKEYKYDAQKWQLISTHTARRTAITNALEMGMEGSIVRKLSGHESAAFERYNRVSQSSAADIYLKMKQKKEGKVEVVEETKNDNGITEAHKVLIFLGMNAIDVLDITDINRLERMIYARENEILDKMNTDDFYILKNIFNSNLSFKDKCLKIQDLMKN